MSLTHSSPSRSKHFSIQASLCSSVVPLTLSAMVDSGAEDNFVDEEVAQQAGFPIESLETPIVVRALDGKFLALVTHQTTPLQLILSGNHRELISLKLMQSPSAPIVLGHPWLVLHNPHRDFLNCFVFVYLDDILIFSRSLEEHIPHVRLVLQRLLEKRLYVKVEKCEFHASSVTFLGHIIKSGQVEADPEKIKAVAEWLVPTSVKQLQRFLGFANFYRRFIKNYSSVVAPLTRLTSSRVPFSWSPHADAAFRLLKERFTSAPILTEPDPSWQFILEVDASAVGVGAVLSQQNEVSQKVSPGDSHRQNATMTWGNRELLAVKLALEEWRHWLERAELPFLAWTDHKNLAYIQTAKRLNSRQARWALFFDRFNFTITYRPGSKNTKPHALSRQFSVQESPSSPDTIVPPSCVVGAVTWLIEATVREAQRDQPDPGDGPPDRLFIPDSVRSQVLLWGHNSRIDCHPGYNRTLRLLRCRFWWPTMDADTRAFVTACSPEAPFCSRDSRPPGAPCFQAPWHPLGHRLRPGPTVYLPSLEGVLLSSSRFMGLSPGLD